MLGAAPVPLDRLLQIYPMFLFLGLKIRIPADFRTVDIEVPFRFYLKNNTGVMFGAAMSTASDPFPALLLQKIFGPSTAAFTARHTLDYLRPARSAVRMHLALQDDDIRDFARMLKDKGSARKTFRYYFTDDEAKRVARVTSTAYLRDVRPRPQRDEDDARRPRMGPDGGSGP